MVCLQWAHPGLVALCSETPGTRPYSPGVFLLFSCRHLPYVALGASLASGTNYACGLSVKFRESTVPPP